MRQQVVFADETSPCRLEYLSAQWQSSVRKWHQNPYAGLCAQWWQICRSKVLQRGGLWSIFLFKAIVCFFFACLFVFFCFFLLFVFLRNTESIILLSLAVGPGEEVADECFLCCRMSCQLPAVWLVTMVRVHTHLWAGRYVCVILSAAVFLCYNNVALQVEVSQNILLHQFTLKLM